MSVLFWNSISAAEQECCEYGRNRLPGPRCRRAIGKPKVIHFAVCHVLRVNSVRVTRGSLANTTEFTRTYKAYPNDLPRVPALSRDYSRQTCQGPATRRTRTFLSPARTALSPSASLRDLLCRRSRSMMPHRSAVSRRPNSGMATSRCSRTSYR